MILLKFVFFFLIIVNEINYLLSRPIPTRNLKNSPQKRQVVQPTWLSRPDLFFIDPDVRITEQNLKEAAGIRESIQRAIDTGTFAVNDEKPKVIIKPSEFAAIHPNFEKPLFDMQLDSSQWNIQFLSAEQRTVLVQQMHQMWQMFWDSSRKFLKLR